MMTYYSKSPARQLREHFDALGYNRTMSRRPRVDDYMRLRTGAIVREHDGRHAYRVEGWISNLIRCTSLDNDWIAYFERDQITEF